MLENTQLVGLESPGVMDKQEDLVSDDEPVVGVGESGDMQESETSDDEDDSEEEESVPDEYGNGSGSEDELEGEDEEENDDDGVRDNDTKERKDKEEKETERDSCEEGNAGWADAISKVLAMGKNSEKEVTLLSKAKRDAEMVKSRKKKKMNENAEDTQAALEEDSDADSVDHVEPGAVL
jgi:hypothetical protein